MSDQRLFKQVKPQRKLILPKSTDRKGQVIIHQKDEREPESNLTTTDLKKDRNQECDTKNCTYFDKFTQKKARKQLRRGQSSIVDRSALSIFNKKNKY